MVKIHDPTHIAYGKWQIIINETTKSCPWKFARRNGKVASKNPATKLTIREIWVVVGEKMWFVRVTSQQGQYNELDIQLHQLPLLVCGTR